MFKIYKKILHYVPEVSYLTYFSIVVSFLSSFFTVGSYLFMYKFFYNLIVYSNIEKSITYSIFIVVMLIISSFLQFIANMLSHKLGFRVETNLRKKGIDILTNANFNFFNEHSSGFIRKTIDDNAAQTHAIIAHLIPDNANALMTPILVLILGYYINFYVGLVLLFLIIITFFFAFKMKGKRKFMDHYQNALDEMSSKTVEYVRGMPIIKIFGLDITSFKSLHDSINNYSSNALKYANSNKWPFVFYQLIFFGITAFILPFIVMFNIKEYVIPLIFIIFLTGVLYTVMIRIMYVFMYSFKGNYAISQLENLFSDMEKHKSYFGKKENFENFDIEFKTVNFSYNKNKKVLDNISFKLKQNSIYALVGASGGGKTTIAKLISGFYSIDSGEILIGGVNLKEYSKKAIIENISFVFQNPKLFKLSIFDNVKIAKKNASDEEVYRALKLARCNEFLNKFEQKEHTIIGSKGVYLSNGEKQRVAIARAFLKNSNIIILDEASASIDSDNEYELQKAIHELIKGKTILMIAHRLTSIVNVDKIFVVENGKIVEKGSHEELIAKGGKYCHYQNLYNVANEWRVINE